MIFPWYEPELAQLASRLERQTLHHAPLILGPNGLGKSEFAEALCELILCHRPVAGQPCGKCQSCQLIQAQTHPDKHHITTENLSIGVDSIRQGIDKLQGSAQLSQNKVLLLTDGQRMTTAAANALLKTLEEPTNNTYIIMTAISAHSLLPTVLSRCEKLVLALPEPKKIQNWLRDEYRIDMSLDEISAYRALPKLCLAAHSEDAVTYAMFIEALQSLNSSSSVLSMAQKWEAHVQDCLIWLQQWCRQAPSSKQYKGIYDLSVQLMQEAQHPGVNKSMLLYKILNRVKEVLS